MLPFLLTTSDQLPCTTLYNSARIVPVFTFPIPPNIPCSSKEIDLIYTKTEQEKIH